MATPYQNPLEAQTALTAAFNPTNEAQRQAIITAASLVPTKPIVIPQPQSDNTDYMTGIAGTAAQIAEGMKTDTTDTSQTDLQKLMASITTPSSVDAYNAAGTSLGIDTAAADARAKRNAVRSAQSKLSGIQAQVQAVVDNAKAQNLQLEQSINQGSTGAGGAGALASGSFLNVRQQEINRQAAISALPLQSLALSAQAEVASLQGDLEYANSTLAAAQEKQNTFFKLLSDDANRKQDVKLKMLDIVIAQGNKKEAAQAEALKTQNANNHSDYTNFVNDIRASSATATSNYQADIAKQMGDIVAGLDPNAKDFQTKYQQAQKDFAALQGQIVDKNAGFDTQLKQLQIQKAQQDLTGGGGLLSVSEAQALGVPYGTTKAQAQGANITPQKQATAAQETTALYANRIEQSNAIISQLDNTIAKMNPLVFQGQQMLPQFANVLKSGNFQSVDQAQRNFVNAVLRRESGAVISPQEFDNARQQYFTLPGDTPATIAQKKANRDLVQQGFISGAGQAYTPIVATDPYASFRTQLQGGEILVNRNGQATAILPSELKASDIKL